MSKRYNIDPIKLREYPAKEVFLLYGQVLGQQDRQEKEQEDPTVQGIVQTMKAGERREIQGKDGTVQIIKRLN